MEPTQEELLSALQDAEKFISVTLLHESLSAGAQMRRQQLEQRLKGLTQRTKPEFDDVEQEVYDDVREDDDQLKTTGHVMTLQGMPQDSTEDDTTQEIYDDTAPGDSQEIYDDTAPGDSQEIYDDTAPADSQEIYDDTAPGDAGIEDYEVAQQSQPSEGTADDLYEVGDPATDDSKSMDSLDSRERSITLELESLTKPIKPEDVDGIIKTGYLDKHRKKGIYIGSKWQKRFCVVRSFVMYYYTAPNATSQKGSIILPGYSATRSSKNSKEFVITKAEDRTFTFMAKSKEDADEWIEAIKVAANTNAISKRQSEILERLRSTGEDDTSSICVNENGSSNLETTSVNDEPGEMYDDVGQDNSSDGTPPPQPARPSKPAAPPPDDDEEMYEDVGADAPPQPERISKPAPPPPEEEEMYNDVVGDSTPPQPVRPQKPAAQLPPAEVEQENYDDVGITPPSLSLEPERPTKAAPAIPATVEPEEEDFYDDVGVITSPPPQPERPKRPVSEIAPTTEEEEELYDDVGTEAVVVAIESKPPIPGRTLPQVPTNDSKPSPPLAPRIPLPPTPNETPKPTIPPRKNSPEIQTNGIAEPAPPTPPLNKAPPPPLPDDKIANKSPPPPLPETEEEEEKQEIDYGCIYQALWDCKPDADDELEFCRGDLLYIYEKPHSDWWIGSKFKPQGYDTRLIPTNYLTQAYDL